jgi:hypothetical protein
MVNRLHDEGWTVAIHNDYIEGGRLRTFWLFTHAERGIFAKGEAETNRAALEQVIRQVEHLRSERETWEKRMADLVEAAKAASLELAYLMEQVKARPNGSVATAKANLDKALHTSSKGGQ